EMARCPNCKYAFEEIAKQRHDEARPTHQAANIFCADITAAKFAHVLASAHANEIVTRGKATEKICPEPNPGCLGPVSRVQLFHPRHRFINQLSSNSRLRAVFTQIACSVHQKLTLPAGCRSIERPSG